MYAVIHTGGKQYRVAVGDSIKLERLLPETPNQELRLDRVLMIASSATEEPQCVWGKPYIAGAYVTADVVHQGRHPKIHIIKFRRRKHYMRKMGHRQYFTQIKITGIFV